MEKDDLDTLEVQLKQVELALKTDPDNPDLGNLQKELQELIELTKAAQEQNGSSATNGCSAHQRASTTPSLWSAGDDCLAKYSNTGAWYPARITSVGGSEVNRVFSVVFKDYNTTELVKASEIKPLPPNYVASLPAMKKRKLTVVEEEEKERKKKKNEKKMEARAMKAKEQSLKQATWQKFAKKSEKKGVHIAGLSGTSIFRTPDNPLGRVGVTGSGRGMTETALRSKHKFEVLEDDAP